MKNAIRDRQSSLKRRKFLKQLFIGVAAAGGTRALAAERRSEEPYTSPIPQTQGKPPQFKTKLRITKVETFLVKPRWLFLKVHTDAGIVGLGEPILEGRAKTCAAAVEEVAPYLIGKDPRNVVHHWQAIYRHAFYRGGPLLTSVLSGIEQALWDIKGKFLGVPVYELLGGPTRDRVRVYAHVGTNPERLKERKEKGFTAFKTGIKNSTQSGVIASPKFIAARAILRIIEDIGIIRGMTDLRETKSSVHPDGVSPLFHIRRGICARR